MFSVVKKEVHYIEDTKKAGFLPVTLNGLENKRLEDGKEEEK